MRIDQLTEVFVKHLGARKDGAALIVPADSDATVFVALEGETLSIVKVARVEVAETLVYLDTAKGERYVIAAEDVRAVKIDRSETLRRGSAGFGK
jgi:hypothetical protein